MGSRDHPREGGIELAEGIHLRADETVLWHGQPGWGVSAWERRRTKRLWLILTATLGIAVVTCLGSAGGSLRGGLYSLLMAFAIGSVFFCLLPSTMIAGSVYLYKLIGGCGWSITGLAVLGPVITYVWGAVLINQGAAGLSLLLREWLFWLGAGLLAASATRLVFAAIARRQTHYYATNQRLLELRAGTVRSRLVWHQPLPKGFLQLRVIWPFGQRDRGHLAIGMGRRKQLMRFLPKPDAVLQELQAVLALAQGKTVESGEAAS